MTCAGAQVGAAAGVSSEQGQVFGAGESDTHISRLVVAELAHLGVVEVLDKEAVVVGLEVDFVFDIQEARIGCRTHPKLKAPGRLWVQPGSRP